MMADQSPPLREAGSADIAIAGESRANPFPRERPRRGFPMVLRLVMGLILFGCFQDAVLPEESAKLESTQAIIRQLDDDDYRSRDNACCDLMNLVRRAPDPAQKRRVAIDLVKRIRGYFFEKYGKLSRLMVEDESDNLRWITDSFERLSRNKIPKESDDFVEIAFEDVLCRIRGLRLEAIYGREEGMVAIDAGKFIAGSSKDEVEEVLSELGSSWGVHSTLYVESEYLYERVRELKWPFYISRRPVTVAEFQAFLADTNSPMHDEAAIRKNKVPGNPVCVGINEERALVYLYWAGKRLPCEEEWEKAARGMYGRRYAHGNRTDPTMHLGEGEGGVTSFPYVSDFYPICKREIPEKKRRYFTGPFGAESFGLYFESTQGSNRRPVNTVVEPTEPPPDYPPRAGEWASQDVPTGHWVCRTSLMKGGTVDLSSTAPLFPRVAARSQILGRPLLGSDPSRLPYLFFRCALDIPEYGRRLHREESLRVEPCSVEWRKWQATGIQIKAGDGLVFRASGSITTRDGLQVGPLGRPRMPPKVRPFRIDDEFALIGMVGLGTVWDEFLVGHSLRTIARKDGELMLRVNRSEGKGLSGAFVVAVRVYR
ncbi:MAG: SUMF1/EgtB/PvdO family nonheme iron enzyme [Candidatus Latescibacteria bacterium]|nr:SUMF1/EgtB/PvdO family nonheme iron enzyme [Candidatus Latescibacterota bacterium]